MIDDNISRKAAIDVLGKIFPADPMRNDYTKGITCGAALATEYIKQLPAAQPQIIKCGHCRYWRRKTDTYTQGFCDIWRISRVRKDFCSEGRRKADLEETDP